MTFRAQPPPSVYAAGKLPTMRARWSGAPGAAAQRLGAVVWPGVPGAALLGFTANAVSASERYCDGFCAVGLYQTPEATWTRLAGSDAVRTVLGRAATGLDGDWQHDIDGQTAVGLLDYRAAGITARSRLPGALQPTDGASLWFAWVAVMGYVVGAAGAANVLQTYLGDVTAPQSQLPVELVRRVATDGSRASAYPTLRAWQRLATGRALAASLGQDLSWWDSLPTPGYEAALADTYNNDAPAAEELPAEGMFEGYLSDLRHSARMKLATIWAVGMLASLAVNVARHHAR